MGYKVSLASDIFRPAEFEEMYGVGRTLEKCEHIQIPQFKPVVNRLSIPQRLQYSRRVWPMFSDTEFDVVFSTQSSPFILPRKVFHFVYNVSNVYAYPPAAAKLNIHFTGGGPRGLYLRALRKYAELLWSQRAGTVDWFFAVGS